MGIPTLISHGLSSGASEKPRPTKSGGHLSLRRADAIRPYPRVILSVPRVILSAPCVILSAPASS